MSVIKATVSFNGKNINVTVTSKAAAIEEWVADIMQQYGCSSSSSSGGPKLIVGVETERRPGPLVVVDGDDIYFDSEWVSQPTINDYNNNKVATFQLCIDTKCLIIQLIYLDYMPQCLKDFLRSQNFLFVGVNIADYTSPVMCDHRMVWNLNVKDLQFHMIQKDPRKCFMLGAWPSIKRLAKEIVGLDIGTTDHIRTGDWEVRVLSKEQIMFACFEAYASYAVGCNFFRGS